MNYGDLKSRITSDKFTDDDIKLIDYRIILFDTVKKT